MSRGGLKYSNIENSPFSGTVVSKHTMLRLCMTLPTSKLDGLTPFCWNGQDQFAQWPWYKAGPIGVFGFSNSNGSWSYYPIWTFSDPGYNTHGPVVSMGEFLLDKEDITNLLAGFPGGPFTSFSEHELKFMPPTRPKLVCEVLDPPVSCLSVPQ